MGFETSWLNNRLTRCAVALAATGAIAVGFLGYAPCAAYADESAQTVEEASAPQSAPSVVPIAISGDFDQNAADQIVAAINRLRLDAGVPELVASDELAGYARTRAAEHAFDPSLSHVRPDGSSALSADFGPIEELAELLAFDATGASSPEALFDAQILTRGASDEDPSDPYVAQFASLVSAQADSIGVAAFTTSGGSTALAIVLGAAEDNSAAVDEGKTDEDRESADTVGCIYVDTRDLTVQIGTPEPLELSTSAPAPSYSVLYKGVSVQIAGQTSWRSSNSDVIALDESGSTLTAVDCGEATLTLSVGDVPLGSVAVAVAADAAPVISDVLFEADAAEDFDVSHEFDAMLTPPDQVEDPSDGGEASGKETIEEAVGETAEETVEETAEETGPLSVSSFVNPPTLYVALGSEWSPAAALEVVLPDGSPATIEPVWSYPESPAPDEAGAMALTFDLDVNGVVEQAIQTVQFVETWNADLGVIQQSVGENPALPACVEVFYGDTLIEVPVTWSAPPEGFLDEYGALAVPGILTFVAALPGTLGDFTVTLSVEQTQQAPVPISAASVTVITGIGVEPVLPDTVDVTFSDGGIASLPVLWDAVDPTLYASAGTFKVTGAIEGTDEITTTANVVVEHPVAINIESPAVTTSVGIEPVLPETVLVTWSDGSQSEVPVLWEELSPERFAHAGTFVAMGSIEEDDTARASCTVTVEEAAAPVPVSVQQPPAISTSAGVTPVLPEQVDVVYSDQSIEQHAVLWDAIDAGAFHSGGTFTVMGRVDGTDFTVALIVDVAPAYVTGVQNNLGAQTAIGVMPKLPDTASVRWSNGDVTNEKVVWPSVDPASVSHRGTFTVNGTVAGYTVPCQVTVVEQVVKTDDSTIPIRTASHTAAALGGLAVVSSALLAAVSRKRRA